MEKRHAIIIIQNDKGEYLQYFDEIWNSYLFLNCKIQDEKNTDDIISQIEEKYHIKINSLELVLDKIHTKFSEKDKIMKEYHHYFYHAHHAENILENEKYKYFSYEDLLNDERIQQVNSDIVGFIKEIFC